jgi:hypothetical protein
LEYSRAEPAVFHLFYKASSDPGAVVCKVLRGKLEEVVSPMAQTFIRGIDRDATVIVVNGCA